MYIMYIVHISMTVLHWKKWEPMIMIMEQDNFLLEFFFSIFL